MGRQPTFEDQEVIARRAERLPVLVSESDPVLIDFAEALELQNPQRIIADPWTYLPAVAQFMRDQSIDDPEDRIWIVTRLGYFIAQLIIAKLGGRWAVSDTPEGRFYKEYVITDFEEGRIARAAIAPFALAEFFTSQRAPRDLAALVLAVEHELAG